MKIVFATGIYPPDIGGPATYVRSLTDAFTRGGVDVTVVTYAHRNSQSSITNFQRNSKFQSPNLQETWKVVRVAKSGGPLLRWWRYAKALKRVCSDADLSTEALAKVDAVIAFSSVSCGVPLWLCRRFWPLDFARGKPKLLLRLGGDFFWERYTDQGGMKGLREFYNGWFGSLIARCSMGWLLRSFDHTVFSTRFQEEIYEKHYRRLPSHSVIENAVPEGEPTHHKKHEPLRLLYVGRFVAFKNLGNLLHAIAKLHEPPLKRSYTLTLIGSGPMEEALRQIVQRLDLRKNVTFFPPARGAEVHRVFSEHDLLVLPSLTEISPNVALEARAYGLPVLLTKETGLSTPFTEGLLLKEMKTAAQIQSALLEVLTRYDTLAAQAAKPPPARLWQQVASEYLKLISAPPAP